MPTIFDQPNSEHANNGTISDGVTIAASGVRLTNTDSGRIYGGVTFTAGGSTLINQLGGVISLTASEGTSSVLITGSDGADTVINAGLIKGVVALGGGADIYVDRSAGAYGIDLGSGNDVYRFESAQPVFLSAVGGEGQDRLILAAPGWQYWGEHVSGFEHLEIEAGGTYENFSGYQSITLATPVAPGTSVHLRNCINPTVDISLSGQSLGLASSSLRSITGGDTADYVELGAGSSVSEGISLGGGDDWLTLYNNLLGNAPTTIPVLGGSGSDTLMLNWFSSGEYSFNLSSMQGFEKLNVKAWYIDTPSTVHVSNVSGLTDIDIGRNITLILSSSIVPDARVGGAFGGGLTLEAGVVISRYGFPEDGFWDDDLDKAQGDPALSTTIINRGSIAGDVRFYIGDDLYDGRDGSVGGTVYGNAGNDTLLGGLAAETLVGGFGADILEGNGGADVLTGGAGFDLFRGTASGLNGDTITDFAAGDKIVISSASLAGFSFSLSGNVLTYSGGTLTLTGFTGQLQASAAAGGGVELTVVPDVRNDFDGDGRSDVLLRHGNGTITNWLGQASGGFFSNHAAVTYGLDNAWGVAGIGDFNGDGHDDLLLRHANGTITDWLGQANGGFYSNHAAATYGLDNAWQVAGTGDFNGDGFDDVLLRHDNGTVTDWLGQANGTFFSNHAAATYGLPAGWQVAGTGDFNGDGLDDVLLKHDNGAVTNWLGQANGTFFSNHAVASYSLPTGWQVAGIGDFNGDGSDDVLLRHANGTIGEWLGQANGTFFSNHAAVTYGLDPAWHVASIGDFNGDGHDDLLLRHANGTITDWLGQANGTFFSNHAAATYGLDNAWQVQAPDLV